MPKKESETVENTIAAECIAVRLRMLNRVITKIYDDALRPVGLRASQLNILVATATIGVAKPAMLCKALQIETSTLSRNLERMKANGWLEVVPDDDGGCHKVCLAAPKALHILDRNDRLELRADVNAYEDALFRVGVAAR